MLGGANVSSVSAPSQSSSQESKLAREYERDVFPKIAALTKAAEDLSIPQVVKLTEQFVTIVKAHKRIIAAMGVFKKPSDVSFLIAPLNAACKEASDAKQKDFKAPPNHMQTMIDGFCLF